jgi:hypothetical protein
MIKVAGISKPETKKLEQKTTSLSDFFSSLFSKNEKPAKKKAFQSASVNVVLVDLASIGEKENEEKSPLVQCSNSKCGAVLNNKSSVDYKNNIWKCEFCKKENKIDEISLPKLAINDYILSSGKKVVDDKLVVFLLDISGSMSQSDEIPKGFGLMKVKAIDERKRKFEELGIDDIDFSTQNVTHVTRMESLQSAVHLQMEEIYKQHPMRRVVLITFNDKVTIIGDGILKEKVISGSTLENEEELFQIGRTYDLVKIKPVIESKDECSGKLFELSENGATALGPSLAIAIGIASQTESSEVILCTDGIANIGVGSSKSKSFYETISSMAKKNNTTISLIGIEGEDCQLTNLSSCAEKTK